ncbi:SPFH domain-containing protein [Hugenholtzia roseola]|uniref:SPFH domain-containing protein n=1 Tax=Hugenholtzia roseola TaxID=1002 RepID=UPI00040B3328|nr:SPFH domain-containing protein [Hugenholtzia roseola]
MQNKRFFVWLLLAVPFLLGSCSYERVDAGYVGIEVDLYGEGEQSVTPVQGFVWYNSVTTAVYEFPTFVQNSVYSSTEGTSNREFKVTTQDGLSCAFDVSLNYRVEQEKVVSIFKKYRRTLDELSETVIRNYMRQGFNTAASRYTAEDLYQKRETFQSDAEKIIRSLLEPEGFKVEQIVILGTMRLPNSVMQNVEAKVNAKQLSLKKQEELAQAQADAAKKIAETEGYAQSLKIQAEAEAYANKVRQESLTPMLIQQQFIEKWDGKLPIYGEVPKIFKDVSGR